MYAPWHDIALTGANMAITQNGVEVANAVANVALNSDDKVVTFGANFVKPRMLYSLRQINI